jgi:SAM-dependent methyltransferase
MSDPSAVRAEWAAGDYPSVGERLRPAAEALVAALEPLRGTEVLDVATGTGNAALAAARAGARVVGVDLTPELLEVARERARAEGLEADFLEGDAEALEFEEDRFDRVMSTFGVIFAPRPAVAAGELARVCTPGGTIGLTTWPLDGLAAAMRVELAPLAGIDEPVAPSPGPPPWTTPEGIRSLFEPRGVEVTVERRADLVWRFADVEAAAVFAERSMSAIALALPAIEAAGRIDAFRAGLRALFARWSRDEDSGCVLPLDYLLTIGTKTG